MQDTPFHRNQRRIAPLSNCEQTNSATKEETKSHQYAGARQDKKKRDGRMLIMNKSHTPRNLSRQPARGSEKMDLKAAASLRHMYVNKESKGNPSLGLPSEDQVRVRISKRKGTLSPMTGRDNTDVLFKKEASDSALIFGRSQQNNDQDRGRRSLPNPDIFRLKLESAQSHTMGLSPRAFGRGSNENKLRISPFHTGSLPQTGDNNGSKKDSLQGTRHS